jgi:hypothetical protein
MDDRVMVMSGSRQSVTGTRDGVGGMKVLAPRGSGLPALVTCVGNGEGESTRGPKKGSGAASSRWCGEMERVRAVAASEKNGCGFGLINNLEKSGKIHGSSKSNLEHFSSLILLPNLHIF